MADDFSDLDRFANDYQAKHPGFGADVLSLPEGMYECEVIEAELQKTGNGKRICAWDVAIGGGAAMRRTYWIDGEGAQREINSLGADLVILGIDARNWGKPNNPKISQALPEALKKIRGVKFRAQRVDEPNKSDPSKPPFKKFRLICRIGGQPTPPPAPAFNEFAGQPATVAAGSPSNNDW